MAWAFPLIATANSVMNVGQAIRLPIPIGLLFVLATDQNELNDFDEQVADQLMQPALASLRIPDNMTARVGYHDG